VAAREGDPEARQMINRLVLISDSSDGVDDDGVLCGWGDGLAPRAPRAATGTAQAVRRRERDRGGREAQERPRDAPGLSRRRPVDKEIGVSRVRPRGVQEDVT
jgi:hypothetical protein